MFAKRKYDNRVNQELDNMPLYEYECEKCGHRSTFAEPMFDEPRLFQKKKRCEKCRSKKLKRVYSDFGISVSRSTSEMLDELKQHAKIQFVPPPPKPPWGDGPPPGGCPYEKMAQQESDKTESAHESTKPVEIKSKPETKKGVLSWLKRSRSSKG